MSRLSFLFWDECPRGPRFKTWRVWIGCIWNEAHSWWFLQRLLLFLVIPFGIVIANEDFVLLQARHFLKPGSIATVHTSRAQSARGLLAKRQNSWKTNTAGRSRRMLWILRPFHRLFQVFGRVGAETLVVFQVPCQSIPRASCSMDTHGHLQDLGSTGASSDVVSGLSYD